MLERAFVEWMNRMHRAHRDQAITRTGARRSALARTRGPMNIGAAWGLAIAICAWPWHSSFGQSPVLECKDDHGRCLMLGPGSERRTFACDCDDGQKLDYSDAMAHWADWSKEDILARCELQLAMCRPGAGPLDVDVDDIVLQGNESIEGVCAFNRDRDLCRFNKIGGPNLQFECACENGSSKMSELQTDGLSPNEILAACIVELEICTDAGDTSGDDASGEGSDGSDTTDGDSSTGSGETGDATSDDSVETGDESTETGSESTPSESGPESDSGTQDESTATASGDTGPSTDSGTTSAGTTTGEELGTGSTEESTTPNESSSSGGNSATEADGCRLASGSRPSSIAGWLAILAVAGFRRPGQSSRGR